MILAAFISSGRDEMHNRRGHFYLIFSRYDYRTVGIIIYCHLFFNWSLVLWNQLKSPSAWKRTSVTWMEQLSSDTKPLACPCSVHSLYLCAYCTHSSDPVTNGQPSTSSFTPGIHMHLKSVQWPLTIIKGRVFDFMKAYDWFWEHAMHLPYQKWHLGYTFYQAVHFLGIKPMTLALLTTWATGTQ